MLIKQYQRKILFAPHIYSTYKKNKPKEDNKVMNCLKVPKDYSTQNKFNQIKLNIKNRYLKKVDPKNTKIFNVVLKNAQRN